MSRTRTFADDGIRDGSIGRSVRIAGDHALVLAQAALDARLDETVQHLDDDAALLLVRDRRHRAAAGGAGGEIFSNVKAGIVYPLFVELKHSWSSPVP